MIYRPRKRFRTDQHADRAERAAQRKRHQRVYEAAVLAGHPTALAAAEALRPIMAANRLLAEIALLPREERQRRRGEYEAFLKKCQEAPADRPRYLKLRKQAIAEYEIFL